MSDTRCPPRNAPLRRLPPETPVTAQQKKSLEEIRELIAQFKSGKLTNREFLDVTKHRDCDCTPSMLELEELGKARGEAIDALQDEKIISEFFDPLPPSPSPVKSEQDSDSAEEDLDYDNSYDLHDDHHHDFRKATNASSKAKGISKRPPRPKKPEPPRKSYNLRYRQAIPRPKRYESYVEDTNSADEIHPKREYYSAVVNAPQPSTSATTEPTVLHMCSHRIITGPNTVDFVIHVKGYNPSNDEPITIRIN